MTKKRLKTLKSSVYAPYPYLYSTATVQNMKDWMTDFNGDTSNSTLKVNSAEWKKQGKTKNSIGYEVQHGDEPVTQSSTEMKDLFEMSGVNIDWDDYYQWDNKCRAYNATFGLHSSNASSMQYQPMPICGFRFAIRLKGSTSQAIKQFQINEVVAHYRQKSSGYVQHVSLDSNYYNDIKFRKFYGPDVDMTSEQKKNIKYDSFKSMIQDSSLKLNVMATTKDHKYASVDWFPCAVTFSFFIDFWGGGSKEKYRVNISEFKFLPGNVEDGKFITSSSRIDAIHGTGEKHRILFERKGGHENTGFSTFYKLAYES